MSEICSKLTLNVPEWRHSGVFNVNFEQISHIALVFPLFTFNKLMPVGEISFIYSYLTAIWRLFY